MAGSQVHVSAEPWSRIQQAVAARSNSHATRSSHFVQLPDLQDGDDVVPTLPARSLLSTKVKRTVVKKATTTTCSAGSYFDGTSCVSCPAGYYNPYSGQTSCRPCASGYFSGSEGASECTACSAGSFSNTTATITCTQCSIGQYQPSQGTTSCYSCPLGSESTSTGASSCTLCSAGTYRNANFTTCQNCPSGETSIAGARDLDMDCYTATTAVPSSSHPSVAVNVTWLPPYSVLLSWDLYVEFSPTRIVLTRSSISTTTSSYDGIQHRSLATTSTTTTTIYDGSPKTQHVDSVTSSNTYTYSLTVYNSIGSTSNNADALVVQTVPAQVIPTVSITSATSIQINWTAPVTSSQLPVLGYRLLISNLNSTASVISYLDSSITSATIQSLTIANVYQITLYSYNQAGLSTAGVTSVTMPAAPSAPTFSRFELNSHSSAVLTWSSIYAEYVEITSYTIKYNVLGSGDVVTVTVNKDSSSLTQSYTLTNLLASTTYVVSISATNYVGTSSYSSSREVTTPGVPSQPSVTVSSVSSSNALLLAISVQATTADLTSTYAPVNYFTVYSRTSTSSPFTLISNRTLSSFVFTAEASTTYQFYAVVSNVVGSSIGSTYVNATTISRPSTPTLTCTLAAATTISCSWSTQVNATSFALRYKTASDSSYTTAVEYTYASGTSSYTLVGLSSATTYQFVVVATNGAGSTTSSVASATTASVPTAVTNTAIAFTAYNALSVDGTSPSVSTYTPITSYSVLVVLSTDSTSRGVSSCSSLPCSVTLNSLTAGSNYVVSVAAVNSLGTGAYSTTTTVKAASAPSTITPTASAFNSTHVQVSWTAPTVDSYAPITSFTVTSRTNLLSNENSKSVVQYTVSSSVTSLLISIAYASRYQFSVIATNGVGSSSESSTYATITTPSAPEAPTNLGATTNSNSATVTFTASTQSTSSFTSPTITYTVQYQLSGSATWTTFTSTGTTTSYTISLSTGLYVFRVIASNYVGSSSAVTVSNIAVVDTSLPYFTSFQISSLSSVDLSFTYTAGTASRYFIESNTSTVFTQVYNGTSTSTTITNSKNFAAGDIVQYRLRALVNGVFTSYSSVITLVVPSMPDAPTLSVSLTSALGVYLSWTQVSSTSIYTVTGYNVQYFASSSALSSTSSISSTSWTTLYSGSALTTSATLSKATYYYFRVGALITGTSGSYSSASSAILTYDVPPTPTLGTISQNTENLTVTWSSSYSSSSTAFALVPVTYTLQQRLGDTSDSWTTVASSTSSTTYVVNVNSALTRGGTYYYRVSATSQAGTSSYSSIKSFTIGSTPSSSTITLIVPGITTATIFDSQATSTSTITNHIIQVRASGSSTWRTVYPYDSDSASANTAATGTSTVASISNLSKYTTYFARSKWSNMYGDSSYSSEYQFQTSYDAPSEPLNFAGTTLSTTSIMLTWSLPSSIPLPPSISSTTYYYQIMIAKRDVSDSTVRNWSPIYLTNTNVLSYNVTGLVVASTYYARIQVSTPYSDYSNFTSEITVKTQNAVPPTPSIINYVSATTTSLSVTVARVSSYVELPTLFYSLYYTPLSNGVASGSTLVQFEAEPASSTATTISFSVTGLSAGTTYALYATATNNYGSSAVTSTYQFTTSITISSAPLLFNATSITDTSLILRWSPPSYTGGASILAYALYYSVGGVSKVTTVSGTTYTLTISGLSPNSTYNFTCAARNAAGFSDKNFLSTTTQYSAPAVVSFTATGDDVVGFSAGDSLTIYFDGPTTGTGSSLSKSTIDSMLSFSSDTDLQTNGAYVGRWDNSRTLVITFTSVSGVTKYPTVGLTKITFLSSFGLRSSDSTRTLVVSSTSPALSGNFGVASSIYASTILNTPASITINEMSTSVFTGITINSTVLSYIASLPASVISAPVNQLIITVSKGTINSLSSLTFTITNSSSVASTSFTYSPPSYYYGSDSITFSFLSNSVVKSAVIVPVTVNDINFPPVLSMATTSITAFLSGDYVYFSNAANMINITDLDFPYGDDTSNVIYADVYTVIVQVTVGQLSFSSRTDTTFYSFVYPTGTSYVTIKGSLNGINSALKTMRYYANTNKAGTLSIYVTDPVGASVSSSMSINVACSATLPGPSMLSARYDDSLISITVTFDNEVANAPTTSFACSNIFDTSRIGSSSRCLFTSSTSLTVYLGSTADIVPGDSLTLLTTPPTGATVAGLKRCTASTLISTGSITVSSPYNPPTPAFSVVIPSISSCDDIAYIPVRNPTGLGGRSATYTWGGTLLENSKAVKSYNSIDGTTSSVSSSTTTIAIRPALLTAGASYTLTITITNVFGVSSTTYSGTVRISALPLPTLAFDGPSTISLSNNLQEVSLSAVASICSSQGDLTFTYQWSAALVPLADQSATDSALTTAVSFMSSGSITTTSSRLRIPSKTLLPGRTYQFTVLVGISGGDPDAVSSVTASVYVGRSGLKASIAGGAYQETSRTQDLSLDASASGDIDADETSFTYTWKCTDLNGDNCVDSTIDGVPSLTFASQSILTITSGKLAVGTYTFSLTITGTSTGRTASTSVTRVVVAGSPPVASIDSYPSSVGGSSSFYISASVSIISTSPGADVLTYQWSVADANTGSSVDLDLSDSEVATGANSLLLHINPSEKNLLTVGSTYTFSIKATDGDGQSSSAKVDIFVKTSPYGGNFYITPSNCTEWSTTITITATNWKSVYEPLKMTVYYTTDMIIAAKMVNTSVYNVNSMKVLVDNVRSDSVSLLASFGGISLTDYTVLIVLEVSDVIYGLTSYSYQYITIYPASRPSTQSDDSFMEAQIASLISTYQRTGSADVLNAGVSGAVNLYYRRYTTSTTTSSRRRLLAASSSVSSSVSISHQTAIDAVSAVATSSQLSVSLTNLAYALIPASEVTVDHVSSALTVYNTLLNTFTLSSTNEGSYAVSVLSNAVAALASTPINETSYSTALNNLITSAKLAATSIDTNLITTIGQTRSFTASSSLTVQLSRNTVAFARANSLSALATLTANSVTATVPFTIYSNNGRTTIPYDAYLITASPSSFIDGAVSSSLTGYSIIGTAAFLPSVAFSNGSYDSALMSKATSATPMISVSVPYSTSTCQNTSIMTCQPVCAMWDTATSSWIQASNANVLGVSSLDSNNARVTCSVNTFGSFITVMGRMVPKYSSSSSSSSTGAYVSSSTGGVLVIPAGAVRIRLYFTVALGNFTAAYIRNTIATDLAFATGAAASRFQVDSIDNNAKTVDVNILSSSTGISPSSLYTIISAQTTDPTSALRAGALTTYLFNSVAVCSDGSLGTNCGAGSTTTTNDDFIPIILGAVFGSILLGAGITAYYLLRVKPDQYKKKPAKKLVKHLPEPGFTDIATASSPSGSSEPTTDIVKIHTIPADYVESTEAVDATYAPEAVAVSRDISRVSPSHSRSAALGTEDVIVTLPPAADVSDVAATEEEPAVRHVVVHFGQTVDDTMTEGIDVIEDSQVENVVHTIEVTRHSAHMSTYEDGDDDVQHMSRHDDLHDDGEIINVDGVELNDTTSQDIMVLHDTMNRSSIVGQSPNVDVDNEYSKTEQKTSPLNIFTDDSDKESVGINTPVNDVATDIDHNEIQIPDIQEQQPSDEILIHSAEDPSLYDYYDNLDYNDINLNLDMNYDEVKIMLPEATVVEATDADTAAEISVMTQSEIMFEQE